MCELSVVFDAADWIVTWWHSTCLGYSSSSPHQLVDRRVRESSWMTSAWCGSGCIWNHCRDATVVPSFPSEIGSRRLLMRVNTRNIVDGYGTWR